MEIIWSQARFDKGENLVQLKPEPDNKYKLNIQTGPNQLNHYYIWPAVIVIQLVWPGLCGNSKHDQT